MNEQRVLNFEPISIPKQERATISETLIREKQKVLEKYGVSDKVIKKALDTNLDEENRRSIIRKISIILINQILCRKLAVQDFEAIVDFLPGNFFLYSEKEYKKFIEFIEKSKKPIP